MLTVRKTISIFSALLLLSAPAWAMKTPVLGGYGIAPSTSVTNYGGFRSSGFLATNDQSVRGIVSMNGTFEGLVVYVQTAPDNGAGTQSYVYTLQKNGSDTTITCTISEALLNCSDTTHSVSMTAGDNFSLKVVPSGTPTTNTVIAYGTIFNSGSGGGSLIYSSANGSGPSNSATETINVNSNLAYGQSGTQTIIPTAGTISSLYVLAKTAPGAAASGKQYAFTIQKNNVDQTITCTILETATACNDTSNSFSVVAGDSIKLKSVPTGTPAAGNEVIALKFTPTIDGESIYAHSYQSAFSNSVDTFIPVNGYSGHSTTESATYGVVSPYSGIVLKKLYATNSNAPGASKTITYTVRINGASSTTTCQRTGTGSGDGKTTCSDSTNLQSLAIGDIIEVKHSPSGTPTVGSTSTLAYVLYIDPSDKLYGSTYYDSTLN